MSLSDQEKLDILWKKLGGVTQTSSSVQLNAPKDVENETIGSPVPLYSKDIWTYAEMITLNPPTHSTQAVDIVSGLILVKDSTSPRAFIASSAATPSNPGVRLIDWIPPSFGPDYSVRVYVGGVYTPSTSETYPWYFDYAAGILYFSNSVPESVITLSGYRYIGKKGLLDQAKLSPLLYEITTGVMNVGDTMEFEAKTGINIKLTDLWIDDTTLAGTDVLFRDCECIVECHWYSGYNSANPYIFKALKLHLQDDGTYYISGTAYSGPRFVDLINLEYPESGVTYWKITKINQRGRVHLKFNYFPNA